MEWGLMFFLKSMLIGAGLAMDAFSVSLANGLNEPRMSSLRMQGIAGIFAFFQFLMPLIGWICVRSVLQHFQIFGEFIPWIALLLLGYIGGKMLLEGIRTRGCPLEKPAVGFSALLLQGLATSIDALSVGFTIADYALPGAFVCCLLIGFVTFLICLLGLALGKRFGTCLSGKASILGGLILILIGLEIFLSGLL